MPNFFTKCVAYSKFFNEFFDKSLSPFRKCTFFFLFSSFDIIIQGVENVVFLNVRTMLFRFL